MIDPKTLIEMLGRHGRGQYNPIKHHFAKQLLHLSSEKFYDDLLAALESENQDIVLDVAEILGKCQNKKAVPYLKKILNKDNLWGMTKRNLAIALIKLGDKDGIRYLKSFITNPKNHRDLRIRSAEALIKLRITNVFEKDEFVDFTGDSMGSSWPKILNDLVNKLRQH